jgi:hypothetical protein
VLGLVEHQLADYCLVACLGDLAEASHNAVEEVLVPSCLDNERMDQFVADLDRVDAWDVASAHEVVVGGEDIVVDVDAWVNDDQACAVVGEHA